MRKEYDLPTLVVKRRGPIAEASEHAVAQPRRAKNKSASRSSSTKRTKR